MKARVTIERGYPVLTLDFDSLDVATAFAAVAAGHIVQDKDTKSTVHIELIPEVKDEQL